MAAAYTFLRRAEHRLQLQRLRRTHLLPEHSSAGWPARWLLRARGERGRGVLRRTGPALREVRRLHEKLFYRPLLHAVAVARRDCGSRRRPGPGCGPRFAAPDAALRHLAALTVGVSRAAIQRTCCRSCSTFSSSPDPDGGLLSYRQVSEALADTPWYLRLLRDEGSVAQRLAPLLGSCR